MSFRLGAVLPTFGAAGTRGTLLATADAAIDAGAELLMVSDHVHVTEDVSEPYPEPFLEAFQTLTFLAGARPGPAFGVSVLVLPYRHPLLVARQVSTLAALSQRRVVLGVGSGWAEQEFRSLGLEYADRGSATDRSLEVLASLALPAELWIGGGTSAPALRRASSFRAAWHPISPTRTQFTAGADRMSAAGSPMAVRLRVLEGDWNDSDDRPMGQGAPEQIRDDVRVLEDAGVEDIVLDPGDATMAKGRLVGRPFATWLTAAVALVSH